MKLKSVSNRDAMSDKPTINVTRGRRNRSKREPSSNKEASGGSFLPGPMDVVSGLVQGVRSVWLAGLGVVGRIEDLGTETFEALVKEGKTWHRTRAEERAAKARRLEQLRDEEEDTVDSFETRVREEIDTVLTQIGLPRRDDVESLRTKIDELEETIDRLSVAVDASGDGPSSEESA